MNHTPLLSSSIFLSFLLIIFSSGCTQRVEEGLLTSISHRYEYEKVSAENGPLYQAISLTGLLPTRKLGVPYYFDASEGMDASFEMGGEKTLYTSQTIGETVTMADVKDVSQKILEVKRMGNKAVHAKLSLVKAQKDKDASTINRYNQAYESAKHDLDEAHRAAVAALKPGIVILQWGNTSQAQNSFGFSRNGYKRSYNDRFKGLLVLGGLKISRLSTLGKDSSSRWEAAAKNRNCNNPEDHILVPTYVLQTRHLLFMDQLNDLSQDSFTLDLDKAVEAESLSILDKIELESLHKQAYSLFGAGEVSGLRTTVDQGCMVHDPSWITVYAVMPSAQNLASKLKQCGFCK